MKPVRTRVHDLLRVRSPHLLMGADGDDHPPDWLDLDTTEAVWVVVRRAVVDGVVSVGVRGSSRSERWPATVREDDIVEHVRPTAVPRVQARAVPAITALGMITPFADHVWPGIWGPAGSVGYELTTGRQVVSASSDLDLVLYADTPLDRMATELTLRGLRREVGSVRIDVLIETPVGGVVADDWLAASPAGLALRTAGGPVVTDDPWRAG